MTKNMRKPQKKKIRMVAFFQLKIDNNCCSQESFKNIAEQTSRNNARAMQDGAGQI